MRLMLTGGAGFIGSHVAVSACAAGHDPIIFDNFTNSDRTVPGQIEQIVGRKIEVIEGDVRDRQVFADALKKTGADAVIHLAGLKAVGESVAEPMRYYENNVIGSLRVVQAMEEVGLRRLVFSSSATVYGEPMALPITETHPRSALNPYGRTKLMVEDMLSDLWKSDPTWRIGLLRYFNPVGAHESGLIGENPQGTPNNLMPFICRVAAGALTEIAVFGHDYDTPDGTGVRDYIHIEDLAEGHIAALTRIGSMEPAIRAWNLGTGCGYSVLEVIRCFEKVNDLVLPYRLEPRRAGDVASTYASADRARDELEWQPARDLSAMCRSAWVYQSMRLDASQN